jgi:hypothetical protein
LKISTNSSITPLRWEDLPPRRRKRMSEPTAYAIDPTSTVRVPAAAWLRYLTPEMAGFSSAQLAAARTYWESLDSAAFFVVCTGIAVLVDWGETTRRFRCHSVRRSLWNRLPPASSSGSGLALSYSLRSKGAVQFGARPSTCCALYHREKTRVQSCPGALPLPILPADSGH